MFRFRIQALPWRLLTSGQAIIEEKVLPHLRALEIIVHFKEDFGTSPYVQTIVCTEEVQCQRDTLSKQKT